MKRLLLLSLLFAGLAHAADYTISTGTGTVDGDTYCSGVCQPGDTLTMLGTARSSIVFRDLDGTAANPIIIRNDVTESGPLVITRSGGSGFAFLQDDNHGVVVDGSGGWSGQSATCGAQFDGQTQNCGIVITGCNTAMMKIQDLATDLTWRGIEIAGTFPTCDNGTGMLMHDDATTNGTHPGNYYEDWLVEDMYIHDCPKTCMYFGSNIFGSTNNDRTLTLRNMEIRYVLNEDAGNTGFKIKSHKEGTTTIHHNIIRRTGTNPADANVQAGLRMFESTGITYYNNLVEDTLGNGGGFGSCYSAHIQSSRTAIDFAGPATVSFYNNIAIDCEGGGLFVSNRGDVGAPDINGNLYNNTTINAGGGSINTESGGGSSVVQDNIACDGNVFDLRNHGSDTVNNNVTSACSAVGFVNLVGRDLHITDGSSPHDAGGNYVSPPAFDYDEQSRPQGLAEDAGAYEFVESGPSPSGGLQTPKPDPHSIDAGETHHPDYLWVLNEGATSTSEDDGSATDCDLTITGADWGSDAFGNYLTFISANSDEATNTTCTSPITTTGVMCAIVQINGDPDSIKAVSGWYDASDADQQASIAVTAGGFPRGDVVQSTGGGFDINLSSPEVDDNNWNMVCVRQSDSVNDVSVNGSAWDVAAISLTGVFTGIDTISIGSRKRSSTDQYFDGNVLTVFAYDGSKTDANIATIWNSGDPWPIIGVDPSSGPPPVTQRGQYTSSGFVR
jgi:hypothetical protein